ncbi:hypothetical protein DL766_006836 [Monosporascus sp. MC13-8B]|uniref:Glutamyl-tRNA amidotransferase complex subunit Gta3 domain-containing protein n=1 Tax=Monosporascus cannonballus TaxID=155416 RepID=A0ABY0H5S9_9PEZI|nr:hypothetical protein DL762_006736 [Monosporascus cannonballus]RYO95779.1 hypothetical protein DL763_003559 [Monosporascus cannonballus]RYP26101.1 hypothetical protein DL766_006836 [Monosporascus sp. MC13-8B]
MSTIICHRCRGKAARQGLVGVSRALTSAAGWRRRPFHSTTPQSQQGDDEISRILSKPTWSVRSLLPAPAAPAPTPTQATPSEAATKITPQTLSHLLRLSALPQPAPGSEEEARMLADLEAQLGFVRAIREIDTRGVAPLRAIRDETAAGAREQAVALDALRDALAAEDVVGHARRPRRRRRGVGGVGGGSQGETGRGGGAGTGRRNGVEDWDVLGGASETAGPYFVVRSGGADGVSGAKADRH